MIIEIRIFEIQLQSIFYIQTFTLINRNIHALESAFNLTIKLCKLGSDMFPVVCEFHKTFEHVSKVFIFNREVGFVATLAD